MLVNPRKAWRLMSMNIERLSLDIHGHNHGASKPYSADFAPGAGRFAEFSLDLETLSSRRTYAAFLTFGLGRTDSCNPAAFSTAVKLFSSGLPFLDSMR